MCESFGHPGRLLLHACCGPCSLEPVRLLRARGMEPHVYYANSNIAPAEEYARRLHTIAGWAADEGLAFTEGAYAPDAWEAAAGRIGAAGARRASGADAAEAADADGAAAAKARADAGFPGVAEERRQARCRACYRLRFEDAAAFAAANGFGCLGTTLSVSPYQYTDIIREELERACRRAGVRCLFEDYSPWYAEATRRSRAAGMYRQNYCGCRFSQEEARIEREERAAARAREKAARAAAREPEERRLADRRRERAAYDAKQARKRAVLKQLRSERAEQAARTEAATARRRETAGQAAEAPCDD